MRVRIQVLRTVTKEDIDFATPKTIPAGTYSARREARGTFILQYDGYRVRLRPGEVREINVDQSTDDEE